MNLPPVAADVRRLTLLRRREGRSEPPDVGCYQRGVVQGPNARPESGVEATLTIPVLILILILIRALLY
jgi:hypothetical protein